MIDRLDGRNEREVPEVVRGPGGEPRGGERRVVAQHALGLRPLVLRGAECLQRQHDRKPQGEHEEYGDERSAWSASAGEANLHDLLMVIARFNLGEYLTDS